MQSYANPAIGLEEESDEENETSLDASEIGLFVIDQGRAQIVYQHSWAKNEEG